MLTRALRSISAFLGRSRPQKSIVLKGRYDAAQTTSHTAKWWAAADGLSARQANSPAVRQTLRNRSRYEDSNNCYIQGIADTRAEDTIGRGPRLQMTSFDTEDARLIEREFRNWWKEVGLTDILRTMRRARMIDGESFAVMTSNPRLISRVKLNVRLVEAEQVCQPTSDLDNHYNDGIEFDRWGNRAYYHIMSQHPGEGLMPEWVKTDAKYVIHDFRPTRPGQVRGIPETTPALPLCSTLRAMTLATLEAAESIANFAAVAYTDSPAEDAAQVEPLDEIPLERRMLTTMPRGWKIAQIKPEQPATTYSQFKREIVDEIARAFNMPHIIATLDSSDSNFSAARMDDGTYQKALDVDQEYIGRGIVDRIFAMWRDEAIKIEGYLPQRLRLISTDWSHEWTWDKRKPIDEVKSATAQGKRLENKTTTLKDECAAENKDWEQVLEQTAREKERMQELGISDEDVESALGAKVAA